MAGRYTTIEETRPGRRYTLKIRVSKLYNSSHSAKKLQEGRVADSTGELYFVLWADTNVELLKENTEYYLRNASVREYKGRLEIHLDERCRVEQVESTVGKKRKRSHVEPDFEKVELEVRKVTHTELESERNALAAAEVARHTSELAKENKARQKALAERQKLLEMAEKSIQEKKARLEREERLQRVAIQSQRELLDKHAESIADAKIKSELAKQSSTVRNRLVIASKIASRLAMTLAALSVTIAAGLYIYDFFTIPRQGDVIRYSLGNESVPFVVVADDSDADQIIVRSLDEFREEIRIERRPTLDKAVSTEVAQLRKQGWKGTSPVYNYTPSKKAPHGRPDIDSVVIHVNSEERDEILKKLPGIGAVRVHDLRAKRPFRNLAEVMASKIGVGKVNAEVWKAGIEKGTIVFE